jgi:hypothetical protein
LDEVGQITANIFDRIRDHVPITTLPNARHLTKASIHLNLQPPDADFASVNGQRQIGDIVS